MNALSSFFCLATLTGSATLLADSSPSAANERSRTDVMDPPTARSVTFDRAQSCASMFKLHGTAAQPAMLSVLCNILTATLRAGELVAEATKEALLPTPHLIVESVNVTYTNATNGLVTFRVRVLDAAGHPVAGRVELRGRLVSSTGARQFFAGSQLAANGRANLQHHFIPGARKEQWSYRVVYPRHQNHGFARAILDYVLAR